MRWRYLRRWRRIVAALVMLGLVGVGSVMAVRWLGGLRARAQWESAYEQGKKFLEQQDPDTAIVYLDRAVAADRQQAATYVQRGIAYRSKGFYDLAITDFDTALRFYREHPRPEYSLADEVKAQFEHGQAEMGKTAWQDAIADFSQAIASAETMTGAEKPSDSGLLADVYFHRGEAYRRLAAFPNAIRNYDEAVRQYEEALKGLDEEAARRFQGRLAQAYPARGAARIHERDYAGAVTDFGEAIKLRPRDAEAYFHRGVARMGLDDFAGAVKDFDHALDLRPEFAEAFYNRGLAHRNLSERMDASNEERWNLAVASQKDLIHAERLKPKLAESRRPSPGSGLPLTNVAMLQGVELPLVDPRLAEPLTNRGEYALKQGKWQQAIDDFTEAIRLDPQQKAAYLGRGEACLRRNVPASRKEDLKAAIASLSEVRRLDPDHVQACRLRGEAYALSGDLYRAGDDYSRWIRLEPQNAEAHIARGNVYLELGEPRRAVSDYTAAVRLAPNNAVPYFNRGLARRRLQNLEIAQADFSEAIRHGAEDADLTANAYAMRGQAATEKGEFGRAAADFRRWAGLKPNNARARYNLGNVLLAQENYQGAADAFQAAIRLDPKYAAAHNNLGVTHQRQGQPEAAMRDFTTAIDADSQDATAYYNRAALWLRRDQLWAAAEDYNSAIRLRPDDAAALTGRGVVYQRQGYIDEAIRSYQEAIQADRNYTEAYFDLGLAYMEQARVYRTTFRLGQSTEIARLLYRAIGEYTRAIERNANHAAAYYWRGTAYTELGQPSKASADFAAARKLGWPGPYPQR